MGLSRMVYDITGTNHFVSFQAACKYYGQIGLDYSKEDVQNKIDQNEIVIGEPKINKNQELSLIDGGTRYQITTYKMGKQQ